LVHSQISLLVVMFKTQAFKVIWLSLSLSFFLI
jgi:hypothetical protein